MSLVAADLSSLFPTASSSLLPSSLLGMQLSTFFRLSSPSSTYHPLPQPHSAPLRRVSSPPSSSASSARWRRATRGRRPSLRSLLVFFTTIAVLIGGGILWIKWVYGLPPSKHISNLLRITFPSLLSLFPRPPPIYNTQPILSLSLANSSSPPLAAYSCPSLHPHPSQYSKPNPYLMVATFSTSSPEDYQCRKMLRERRKDGVPERLIREGVVQLKFVLGKSRSGSEEEESRLDEEEKEYGDLIRLGVEENMDDGKTYEFLKELVKRGEEGEGKPQFVLKTDQDTLLHLPNILESLLPLKCSNGVYWGTTMGSCIDNCSEPYFQGMAYALSWPIIEHLVRSELTQDEIEGAEDARTGAWIKSVDLRTKAVWEAKYPKLEWTGEGTVQRVEIGRLLGDWRHWWTAGGIEIMGYHHLKTREEWLSVWAQQQQLWRDRGRPYLFSKVQELVSRP
ncbi:hypothetical protein BDY24DRAFT_388302 [Mrakia frigida]|uniref:uncharacterized protein n=1 Tax=Mrakia frigida TaxID=29902 RepID=UPI003FCC1C95